MERKKRRGMLLNTLQNCAYCADLLCHAFARHGFTSTRRSFLPVNSVHIASSPSFNSCSEMCNVFAPDLGLDISLSCYTNCFHTIFEDISVVVKTTSGSSWRGDVIKASGFHLASHKSSIRTQCVAFLDAMNDTALRVRLLCCRSIVVDEQLPLTLHLGITHRPIHLNSLRSRYP